MAQNKKIAVFSSGITRKSELKVLLGIDEMLLRPVDNTDVAYVAGWGRKPNTWRAKEYANKNNLDYFYLEDGFLHSMGQGVLGAKSCSLVKDHSGIYYDATQASDLESLISKTDKALFNKEAIERAKDAIQRITQNKITKYNNGSFQLDNSIFQADKVVLVIDQTAGDMSLKYGYANENTFDSMLQAALDENPDAQILVKTHPDVIVGKKKGSIKLNKADSRVSIISELINPLVLMEEVDKVYVTTSQMGFEALMLGKHVVCFGVPFYAGWGLTDDRADKDLPVWSRRYKKRGLEEIFVAAYIYYPCYLHPDTNELCELEDVLSYFELQINNRLNSNARLFCFNFTRWKRNHIKAFLNVPEDMIFFVSSMGQAKKLGFKTSDQILCWASKDNNEAYSLASEMQVNIWLIEDGFIRSAGLGTDLTAPASLVLDKTGIYYDPNMPSDLEAILQTKSFTSTELERAKALRLSLIENELSKYNLGSIFDKKSIKAKPDQIIILIPGQVEGDASIKQGCIDIKSNADLIKAVRQYNPDAFLIYKPHPDVVSGNRKGKVHNKLLEEQCDLVFQDFSITDCLAVVNEVHTMTSLVGFEGLLRKLKVVCYGLPFYSNWGLTDDKHTLSRRTRKLKLDELVAATLIDYPLYINWNTGEVTTPEVIVQQLKQQIDKQGGKQRNQIFKPLRYIRKLRNIVYGVLVKKV